MLFVSERCTEDLFKKLNLPESLREYKSTNPIGNSVIYNIEENIALIVYPMDHGSYPDQYYILSVKGRRLNITEKPKGTDVLVCFIEIFVSDDTCDLNDEFLQFITRNAFAARYKLDVYPNDIVITGRKTLPRSPQQIVTYLNKLVIALDGSNDFAISHFVPFCVRTDEFNAFFSHIEQTSWTELSVEAKHFVKEALIKRVSITGDKL